MFSSTSRRFAVRDDRSITGEFIVHGKILLQLPQQAIRILLPGDSALNYLVNPACLKARCRAFSRDRLASAGRRVSLDACAGSRIFRAISSWFALSSYPCKNIPVSIGPKSPAYSRHPVPNEGRFAIVTNVERDAVDADALLTNSAWGGRRSRVVLTPRCWRQVFEKQAS
jgi:hypothetical protein